MTDSALKYLSDDIEVSSPPDTLPSFYMRLFKVNRYSWKQHGFHSFSCCGPKFGILNNPSHSDCVQPFLLSKAISDSTLSHISHKSVIEILTFFFQWSWLVLPPPCSPPPPPTLVCVCVHVHVCVYVCVSNDIHNAYVACMDVIFYCKVPMAVW